MRDLVGRALGPYRVLAKIGEGGMGVVYRAHDDRLDRDVAVKILREEVADDPARLARFEAEAKTVARLQHPNILAIHDVGADAGVRYLVTELLEGQSLRQRLAPGGLPWRTVAEIGLAVADGLTAAHGKGVVHRDLKPENVFLTADGLVKILDFGIASLTRPSDESRATATEAPHVTATGAVLGTVGYMSPEQARGERPDPRSDLFSLGCLLYEMASGHGPFRSDSAAGTLAALLRDEPPLLVHVDGRLARLVAHCLRKSPAERPQSARDVSAALADCLGAHGSTEGPSLAVLPFANMSGEASDDYLCEGLAEEIINALARVPGLRVIARTSAFAIAGQGLDVRDLGSRLDVTHVLEGSVRRAGRRVRVIVQLVDARDGSHAWSERFDLEMTDVLALEDDIAEAVASRLRGGLDQDTREQRRATVDVEAHTLYLQGRYHLARGTPAALAQARACLEAATSRDPGYALAFDALAELCWYVGFFGHARPREAFSQSTWFALRALELDDSLAETHALLGMLRKELDYNWPEVDRELRRARELNREAPLVRLRYAISGAMPHGRLDEAAAEIDAVLRVDPLSVFVRWWAACMAYFARRPQRMLEEGRLIIDLDPTHFIGHWAAGMALLELGARDEAVDAAERANTLSGGIPFTLGFLAYAWGRAGRQADALRVVRQAQAAAASAYVPPSVLSLGYTGLGDWDAAFRWWHEAVEQRDPLVMPLKSYPFFDAVRDDPRYHALLRQMRLEEG